MATINNIKKRAKEITNAFEPESVTAEKVGQLFEDIADVTEQTITSSEEVMQESVRAATQAAQAAEDASGYLSDLQDAIQDLPDGQAVSAQVAINATDIASQKTKTDGKCREVADLEHLFYTSPISEQGNLNNSGEFVTGNNYVSYFYPTKNLGRISGAAIYYYDEFFAFISKETNSSSGNRLTPTIPSNAIYCRVLAYSTSFIMAYYKEDTKFIQQIKLYPVAFDNSVAGIWWYQKSSSSTRRTSSLQFGKCLIKCPSGYEICVYKGELTEKAISTGFVSHDISIDENVYWRVSLNKVGASFTEDFVYLDCFENRKYIDDQIDGVQSNIDELYKDNIVLQGTLPEVGSGYSVLEENYAPEEGTVTFSFSSSDIEHLSGYLCHDNINSGNRIIKLPLVNGFVTVDISQEQAELINKVAFLCEAQYSPIEVKLSIETGSIMQLSKGQSQLELGLDESNQKIEDIYQSQIISKGSLPVPQSGAYTSRSVNYTFEAGEYTFKFIASDNMDKITIALCHDNLSAANRIISLSAATYISTTITAEQAELINKVVIFCPSQYAPINVELQIVSGEIAEIAKAGNPIVHNRVLLGAIVFDGWSYRNWTENNRNSNRIYQMSSLYENSGALNTPELAAQYYADFGKAMVLDEDAVVGQDTNGGIDGSGNKLTSWIDYVYATTGKYPAGSMSFCNMFPSVAYGLSGQQFTCADGSTATFLPAHDHDYKPLDSWTMKNGETTTNGLSVVPLGWRNTDTIDQIEAQIDMASYYKLDYFCICCCLYTGMVVDTLDGQGNVIGKHVDKELFYNGVKDMNVSVRGWGEQRGNHFLVDFMRAKNKHKMKFCIEILANYNSADDETYNVIMDYLWEHFLTDKQYVHFNGRPLLLWHQESYGTSFNRIYHNNHDVIVHFVQGNSMGKFDGSFSYTGEGNVQLELDHEDSNGYKYYKYQPSADKALASVNPNTPMLLPINVGYHSSQRSNFSKNTYCDYPSPAGVFTDYHEIIPPTKTEIKKALSNLINAYSNKQNDCLVLAYAWDECAEGGYLLPNQAEIESEDTDRQGFYKLEAFKEFKESL